MQRADAFAAKLAPRAHEEPQNRFQGMPSDGDSRAINSAMGQAGWIGLHWPADLGAKPDEDPAAAVTFHHFERALAEGRTPASVADAVLEAVVAGEPGVDSTGDQG